MVDGGSLAFGRVRSVIRQTRASWHVLDGCFHPLDPVVDVDIVLPVQWVDTLLEEVDLELDVLRFADGSIRVRDQDTFAEVRRAWAMPEELANRAETTCAQVRTLVAQHAEPFGDAGRAWLEQFLAPDDDPRFP